MLSLDREFAVVSHSVRLSPAREHSLERSHDSRIELTFDRLREAESRNRDGHRITVWPLRGHRVIRVGDSDDPRK